MLDSKLIKMIVNKTKEITQTLTRYPNIINQDSHLEWYPQDLIITLRCVCLIITVHIMKITFYIKQNR